MTTTEITYAPADELPADWIGAIDKLDRITIEDVGDLEREFQALINYEQLASAGDARDSAYLEQVRSILADDLRAMAAISSDPESAGEVLDGKASVAAFEIDGDIFTARGPADPRSSSDWLTPGWRIARLMDSGALAFVGYKLTEIRSAAQGRLLS